MLPVRIGLRAFSRAPLRVPLRIPLNAAMFHCSSRFNFRSAQSLCNEQASKFRGTPQASSASESQSRIIPIDRITTIRIFIAAALGSAIAAYVGPAFFLMMAPPFLLGLFLARRTEIYFNQRWNPYWNAYWNQAIEQFNEVPGWKGTELPQLARSEVRKAIADNSHNLETLLQVKPDKIQFTPLESLMKNVEESSTGEAINVQVLTYGLLNEEDGKRIADIHLVLRGSDKIRVEVQPTGSNDSIVLQPHEFL